MNHWLWHICNVYKYAQKHTLYYTQHQTAHALKATSTILHDLVYCDAQKHARLSTLSRYRKYCVLTSIITILTNTHRPLLCLKWQQGAELLFALPMLPGCLCGFMHTAH